MKDNSQYNYDDFLNDFEYYEDDGNEDFEYYDSYENDTYMYTEDNYDDSSLDYSEDSTDNNEEITKEFPYRNLIIKGIIGIVIVALLIFLIPQFLNTNNNSNDDVVVVKNDESSLDSDIKKLKDIALKYYTEENLPKTKNKSSKLTLNEMEENSLISSSYKKLYNMKKSYVKITKNKDDYSLKIKLVTKSLKNQTVKTKEYSLNNYSYCISTYLCEEVKDLEESSENSDSDTSTSLEDSTVNDNDISKEYLYEYIKSTNSKLSAWSSWKSYEKTSCETKAVSCDDNDFNCLEEVKLYNRKEEIGTYNKVYSTTRNVLKRNSSAKADACLGYEYVKINGTYYKTAAGNYYSLFENITKDTHSNYYGWKYEGRTLYNTPPSDSRSTKYILVDVDYTTCGDTCSGLPRYYYDKYTFSGSLTKVSNTTGDCKSYTKQEIVNYLINNQSVAVNRTEKLYGTVCYKSVRNRSVTGSSKNTKWSEYNDKELLNDGYILTGNKKEK